MARLKNYIYIPENLHVLFDQNISFYNEKPLTIDLPKQIKCKIEKTDVALKGQTVSSSYKPATLTNGVNIQVPPFIESGDEVIVDSRTIEYVKKINLALNQIKVKVILNIFIVSLID